MYGEVIFHEICETILYNDTAYGFCGMELWKSVKIVNNKLDFVPEWCLNHSL